MKKKLLFWGFILAAVFFSAFLVYQIYYVCPMLVGGGCGHQVDVWGGGPPKYELGITDFVTPGYAVFFSILWILSYLVLSSIHFMWVKVFGNKIARA